MFCVLCAKNLTSGKATISTNVYSLLFVCDRSRRCGSYTSLWWMWIEYTSLWWPRRALRATTNPRPILALSSLYFIHNVLAWYCNRPLYTKSYRLLTSRRFNNFLARNEKSSKGRVGVVVDADVGVNLRRVRVGGYICRSIHFSRVHEHLLSR